MTAVERLIRDMAKDKSEAIELARMADHEELKRQSQDEVPLNKLPRALAVAVNRYRTAHTEAAVQEAILEQAGYYVSTDGGTVRRRSGRNDEPFQAINLRARTRQNRAAELRQQTVLDVMGLPPAAAKMRINTYRTELGKV
jgi:hypothetical protein